MGLAEKWNWQQGWMICHMSVNKHGKCEWHRLW